MGTCCRIQAIVGNKAVTMLWHHSGNMQMLDNDKKYSQKKLNLTFIALWGPASYLILSNYCTFVVTPFNTFSSPMEKLPPSGGVKELRLIQYIIPPVRNSYFTNYHLNAVFVIPGYAILILHSLSLTSE